VSYSEEQIEAAVQGLSQEGAFTEAEAVVARAAPSLQRILAQALEEGGWFAESHADEIRKAAALPEEADRELAFRTMLAEEARMGMMIGVAVGWALARELGPESSET